ncbi:MAG: hypothetical protein PVI90_02565 [Desulfobacteraceae bacterium]|jgi:3-hydroxymyristoyl/3-hydroxydecanoyl-(acyl carrier protein) dehydratase
MTFGRHQGWFHFDPKDSIYNDHFPGHAVVPGSLVIWAFLNTVGQKGFFASSIDRFRFKSFISPGTYPFELEVSPSIIRCYLRHQQQNVVTGKVYYDG